MRRAPGSAGAGGQKGSGLCWRVSEADVLLLSLRRLDEPRLALRNVVLGKRAGARLSGRLLDERRDLLGRDAVLVGEVPDARPRRRLTGSAPVRSRRLCPASERLQHELARLLARELQRER